MATHYDYLVIGSGPGGYISAIRAAQLGFKTAIVEKDPTLGGTCLNVGCIPSKALLDSSEHYHNLQHEFAAHGIEASDIKLDFKKMIARKTKVVTKVTKGVEFLMKKNKIDVLWGTGSFKDSKTVTVTDKDGKTTEVTATHVVIATGSAPSTVPGVEFDGKKIISSTEALVQEKVPGKLLVIGAGYIGLEMGSVYARLGSEVTFVEYAERAIPNMDPDQSKEMEKILKKELGITFHFKHKVTGAKATSRSVTVTAEDPAGKAVEFKGDLCLVAVGRKPYTDALGLAKAGIETDQRGFIPVDNHFKTNVDGIYAIGDVIGGKMLAHKAEEEGIFLAEFLAGEAPVHIDARHIPGVVYTWPEVASIGENENELKARGVEYKVGKFPYLALGRATAANEQNGFVKVLADATTDEILGIHMVGARAADLIAEGVTAMTFRASAEDMGTWSHAHPTFAEALKDAALAASGNRALNM